MNALDLVKEVGVAKLGGFDGCLCTNFAVRGVSVDVSCRKSGSAMDRVRPGFYGIAVRVHSCVMDTRGEDLADVAKEVARQLHPEGYDIAVRLCDYEDDAKQRCTYCREPRTDPRGYLCEACLAERDPFDQPIAETHDYRALDFLLPA